MRVFARSLFVVGLSLFVIACSASDAAETPELSDPLITPVAVDDVAFSATIGGEPWNGTPEPGAVAWFPTGMPGSDDPTPFLQLAFLSTVPGDERELAVMITGYPMATGLVPAQNIEVVLTGTYPGGEGEYGFTSELGDDFQIDITRWEQAETGGFLISGTLSGTLHLVGEMQTMTIENGVFENLEVPVQ